MLSSEDKINILNKIANVNIRYSDYTDCFYLTSNIEIKKGSLLLSPTEHRKTKEEAIDVYFNRITNADILVVDAYKPSRKQYIFKNEEFVELR